MTAMTATKASGEPIARVPAGPVLAFDLVAEAESLRHTAPWSTRGHCAKTLLKQADLRIVLIVMRAGARLQEHDTDHRISVQTLTGAVQLGVAGQIVDLPAGHLLVLEETIPHDVVAREDSAFLLTMSWRAAPRAPSP